MVELCEALRAPDRLGAVHILIIIIIIILLLLLLQHEETGQWGSCEGIPGSVLKK